MWFFPLACIGVVAAVFQVRGRWRLVPEHQAILLWCGWAATYALVYSFTGGIFHDYYLVTMSAPMAALTGIGGAALWRSFQPGGWRTLLLPLAIFLTAGWQVLIWLNYPELAKWTVPVLVIAATAAGLGLPAIRGSWWGPVFAIGVLACIGWLWSRDSTAPDILSVAAADMEQARASLRQYEGWESFKKIYTKVSPDIGSLLPDLRRQAPLVSPVLLVGCGIAAGCLLIVFVLAKWRPILAKLTVVAVAVCYLALFVGPAVWALSPLWGNGGMLPAADANVFIRAIREREQRAQQAARSATVVLSGSHGAATPALAGAQAVFVATDFAVFSRSRRGAPGFSGAFGGPGLAGGGGGPGTPRRDNDRSRQDRQQLVAFLKANHNGERWLMAVSGSQQATSYIIEDGISVMPIGGFGGSSPTLGSEPDEIKARLTKMVEDGQIRFFQVTLGRGGFGGGFGRPGGGFASPGAQGGSATAAPPGPQGGSAPTRPQGAGRATGAAQAGNRGAGAPQPGFGRSSATVSQWIQEKVENGKAKKVDRKLYALETSPDVNAPGPRPGRGFGMMGGGDLYDLRPELGLVIVSHANDE